MIGMQAIADEVAAQVKAAGAEDWSFYGASSNPVHGGQQALIVGRHLSLPLGTVEGVYVQVMDDLPLAEQISPAVEKLLQLINPAPPVAAEPPPPPPAPPKGKKANGQS